MATSLGISSGANGCGWRPYQQCKRITSRLKPRRAGRSWNCDPKQLLPVRVQYSYRLSEEPLKAILVARASGCIPVQAEAVERGGPPRGTTGLVLVKSQARAARPRARSLEHVLDTAQAAPAPPSTRRIGDEQSRSD